MLKTITHFLKQAECSYCQENDYTEKKEVYKGWSLYVREEEMYSSLLLYNSNLKKDISYFTQINDSITLLDKDNQLLLKLDYISNYNHNNYALLVPDDSYLETFDSLEKKDKNNDENINAYLILNDLTIQLK